MFNNSYFNPAYYTIKQGEHTLLHLAVDPKSSVVDGDNVSHFPSLGVIQILLECGIDANQMDKDGNTALFCSVKYAIEEVVEEHN
jgi:ankyrin repeat protein